MRNGIAIGMLGLWLVAMTFLQVGAVLIMWNAWAVGVVSAAWGFGVQRGRSWQGWLAGVLGLWLVVYGFAAVLQTGPIHLWNNILVGFGLALAGFLPIKEGVGREQTAF